MKLFTINNKFTYKKDAFGDIRCDSCAGIVDSLIYCKYCGNGKMFKKIQKINKKQSISDILLFLFILIFPTLPVIVGIKVGISVYKKSFK